MQLERVEAGLFQRTMGLMLGISQPHLSCWETGRYKPSAVYLRRLNQFLSLDPLALKVYVSTVGLRPSPLNPLGDAGEVRLRFREWERRAPGGH